MNADATDATKCSILQPERQRDKYHKYCNSVGHMSSERLGEHEASGIAISAKKSKPEGKPSVSQADVCRHNFPSDPAQLPSADPRGEITGQSICLVTGPGATRFRVFATVISYSP